jgi:hypothetical protein
MKHSGWDIDRIVSEVLQRLQSQTSTDEALPPPEKPADARPAPVKPAAKAKQLCLDDRVVSLAAIKDRLQGIRHVCLTPQAVVTPSARDEFRKRGITVERRVAESPTADNAVPLAIVRAETSYDATELLRQVGGNLIATAGASLADAVAALVKRVQGERELGVLLTTRAAPALCLANRHAGVRAAWGGSVRMTREAIASAGANLLILNPVGCTQEDLVARLREFARGGPRACPAEYCEIL